MNQNKKSPLAAVLFGIAVRSFVLMFGRIFVMAWYIYFALQLYTKIESDKVIFGVMLVLSIFGLWQVIELVARATKLTDKPPSK